MLATLVPSLPRSPMRLELLKDGDWTGIATLAIGLASLQTVLEEGNKDDWFGSPLIVRLSVVAAIALTLFIWIELTTPNPLLNLRLLLRRNFGLGSASNVILGFALYVRCICCRITCRRCRATTRSRPARCWPGPGCRSC